MKIKIAYKCYVLLLLFLIFGKISFAQKVTIKVKEQPLINVLNAIKSQTGYNIFYNSQILNYAKKVTLNVTNEDLNKLLSIAFFNQPFKYHVANKTIVLRLDVERLGEFRHNDSIDTNIIKGQVLDIFKTPLEGVTIMNANSRDVKNDFSLTDKKGSFVINGKKGDTLLLYSSNIITDRVIYNGQLPFNIIADLSQGMLERVTIQTVTEKKKDPTRFVDLSNRLYMNLGQVLQGTIPGLSMQLINTSTNVVTKITERTGQRFIVMSADEFLHSGNPNAQEIINGFITGNLSRYIYGQDGRSQLIYAEVRSQVSSAMVPQIRGTNTFGSGLNGMLVVIDGFPQDGFPADYPMSNVESIEVIKDPKELIKWGEKAAGGVILIKTRGAIKNKPTINLNASFYLTPASKFDRNKLRLANSKEYLDYYKALYENGFVLDPATTSTTNIDPALKLLHNQKNGIISDEAFTSSWDSLGSLNNQDQMKLMQQNSFNNIYNLSVLGGTKHYKYNFIGMYNGTKTNALRNYTHTYALSSTNDFMLLKDKLHITWFSNITYNKSNAGTQLDPMYGLAPYQMILDDQGNYVYDYSNTISQSNNQYLKSLGFKEFGTNILQDARNQNNISKGLLLKSRLNWDWKLTKDLNWVTSIYYDRTKNNVSVDYGESTNYTRNIINTYSNYINGYLTNYVPNGDVFTENKQVINNVNVRSALTFNHAYGKHFLGATIGSGGSVYNSYSPAIKTIYGYSSSRRMGLPISLPSGNYQEGVYNYNLAIGSFGYVYPYTLLNYIGGDTTRSRSLNWNGSLTYSYSDYATLSIGYNANYNPNYGQSPRYSKLSTLNGDLLLKPFARVSSKILNTLSFSTGIANTKMPNMPVQYSTYRYQQSNWNNYAMIINNQSPTQQVGQSSNTFYQRINFSLSNKSLSFFIGNNIQKMNNIGRVENSKTIYDSTFSSTYLNAGLNGILFDSSLSYTAEYSKSPEGQTQVNGNLALNILKFLNINSKSISSLQLDMQLENISPMQGLGIQMGTNVSSGNGFGLATNGALNTLPPKNTNYELRGKIGFNEDNTLIDVRYYNRTTSGLTSNVPIYTDPATGLSTQITYSSMQNKGVEFFLKFNVIKHRKLSYNITLNGAYNLNIAKNVPVTNFSVSSSYSTAYRSDYSINNIWSYKWAGLNDQGLPQIYDSKGAIVSNPDSLTLASSMQYSGVSKAPWTGGFINEITFGNLFARSTLVFNFGAVMRRHIPTPSSSVDNSVFTKDRWRNPGDEKLTDIPAVTNSSDVNLISYLAQYSSNSIMSANFIRLQELMIGCYLSKKLLSFLHVKSGYLTLQAQNVALWTKNKYHLDPSTVSLDGRVGLPIPRIYACSINVNF